MSMDLEAMHGMTLSEIYGPRPVEYLGVWDAGGWSLRAYGIAFNRPSVREELIRAAREVAGKPLPPIDDLRSSGAGFVVLHDSEDGCYVLVDWWIQIEMHEAIYYSPIDDPGRLERIEAPVVACVYELGVIDHERRLWLDLVRKDPELVREQTGTGNLDEYLGSAQLNGVI
jgi:hypothetical protein